LRDTKSFTNEGGLCALTSTRCAEQYESHGVLSKKAEGWQRWHRRLRFGVEHSMQRRRMTYS
jgi:hypothetical protein